MPAASRSDGVSPPSRWRHDPTGPPGSCCHGDVTANRRDVPVGVAIRPRRERPSAVRAAFTTSLLGRRPGRRHPRARRPFYAVVFSFHRLLRPYHSTVVPRPPLTPRGARRRAGTHDRRSAPTPGDAAAYYEANAKKIAARRKARGIGEKVTSPPSPPSNPCAGMASSRLATAAIWGSERFEYTAEVQARRSQLTARESRAS